MSKSKLKDFIPPVLIKLIKRSGVFNFGLYWTGTYRSWSEAKEHSTGYDSETIIEKVKNSILKVKRGEAAFERDSVVFDTIEYDWPIVASLMWVMAQSGRLNVMDFGGSLGSTYFQNRTFIKGLKNVSWNVVEQSHFVKCGQENFQDEQLKFYPDIMSCMAENKINIIILSSVLPYLEEPYKLLEKIQDLDIKYVLIDKMPLIDSKIDRLTVQHVPSSIYKASYPAWFFSSSIFYEFIHKNFEVFVEYDRPIVINIPAVFKGMLLIRR